MGGKHKQPNRTKNNTRPSSSSHSAELLGNTIPTFIGFSSLTNRVPAVSGFPLDEANYCVNPDFQVLLKQMNKKDPITRFKALQLFMDLVNNTDVEGVQAVLPLWPRMYCTLCNDVNHKVREISHKAHKAVVSKVKKLIAPYLKELAGPWFTSQYDTYAPAASAAILAFEEAFPSSKTNKAIAFCQDEILLYIYDNLINQTPQSLCNPTTTSPDDMQAKYERTVLSSLQGYILYLQKLSIEQIQGSTQMNKQLLSHSKFWKYAKNKVPLIRSSFYRTLIALCQNAKFLLDGEASRLSTTIFSNLEESDATVLQSLWDAALNILVTIEDCWSHINLEKQLFAKLNKMLRSGGRNVYTIYPNILPLLSKLPEKMLKDKEILYIDVFEGMRHGLDVVPNNQSPSEARIMAVTFVECLKFAIRQSSSEFDFCSSLISEQLIPIIDKLLLRKDKRAIQLPFLTETSHLISYWSVQRKKNEANFDKLIVDFFHLLSELYRKQIDSEVTKESIDHVLQNQVQFIHILINPDQFRTKCKGHVKFEPEESSHISMKLNESPCDQLDENKCSEELLEFIRKQATLYFLNAVKREEKSFMCAIAKIINLLDAKLIFEDLTIAVNESTCFKLFSSYFSKWLMNSEMKCKELIDLSFVLLKYVTNDEKEYILEEFSSNWLCDLLQFDVCESLRSYANDECVFKWVRSEKFTKNILYLVERFIDGNISEVTPRDTITTLLKVKRNSGEFIIGAPTVALIMNVLSQKFEARVENQEAVELSQDLILNVDMEQLSLPEFSVLVTTLFKLSCQRLNNEKLYRACTTGLEIILSLSRSQDLDFNITEMLSHAVREIIISHQVEYYLEHVIDNISNYIDLVVKVTTDSSLTFEQHTNQAVRIIKKFLVRNQETESYCQQGTKMLEKCCHVGYEGNDILDTEYMLKENYLTFISRPDVWEENPVFSMKDLRKYIDWNLYVGSVLNLIFSNREGYRRGSSEANDIKISQTTEENCPKKLDTKVAEILEDRKFNLDSKDEDLVGNICDFFMSVAFLTTFNKYHTGTKYYKHLRDSEEKLNSIAAVLIKSVNDLGATFIYDHCQKTCNDKSSWWILKSTFNNIFKGRVSLGDKNSNKQNQLENCFDDFGKMDISKLTMSHGNFLTILCLIENQFGHRLTEKQWDGIFICTHKFVESFLEKPEYSEHDMLVLLAVSRLYLKLRNTFKNNHNLPHDMRILPETCLAWNEVVEKELYEKVMVIWRKLAKDCSHKDEVSPEWIITLQAVSDVVMDGLEGRRETPSENVRLFMECIPLIMSPLTAIQITSFRVCVSIIPDLVKLDAEIFGNNMSKIFQDGEPSTSQSKKSINNDWSIKKLEKEILDTQGIVDTLLSDFIVGDFCTIEPFTDSFTYTYSYLLLWCFILNACGEAHSSLRVQYGNFLVEGGYVSAVLNSVFKLMPQTVLQGFTVDETCQEYFENCDTLDFREPVNSKLIEKMACFVYRLFLQRLPNCVREWWKEAENKTSNLVDNVTKLYVSPILISNELKSVQHDRETGFDNIEIKTYPGVREVVATYTIDEVKMDLIMTLPPNYPLGTAKIESSNMVVGTSKWRNLLFQICKYLIHQNGTIWDALVIWKNNLDKKFEGVEECYICFSILMGSSFEIPKLCCRTCKKKFHSSCLYKWFSTSNNSTCPICRNLF